MLQVLARDIEQLTDPCLLLGKDTWPRRLIFGKLYCLFYLSHFSSGGVCCGSQYTLYSLTSRFFLGSRCHGDAYVRVL
jgi:hypothetical protein